MINKNFIIKNLKIKNVNKTKCEYKKMRSILCLLSAAVISASSGGLAHAAEAGSPLPSGVRSGEIGREIEVFVDEHRDTLAGMAVSVFEKGSTLYEGYFGCIDKEAGTAVDENSVFEWGSASKTLVWVSVMQQAERGRIDLSADVRDYLPQGFFTEANTSVAAPVTMLDLMNHTGGYQDLLVDLFVKDREDVLSLGEQLKRHVPAQVYEPGTVTAYSNWGTALAAYIVECVSGRDFCEYVHENIFMPLEMEHTALAADLSDNPWVAEKRRELQCYTSEGTLIPGCFYYISLYPAGMCTSTLRDMRLWAQALVSRDERLMSADTWAEFYTPTSFYAGTNVPRNCHGLWVELRASLTVGHGGNTAGCSSLILVEPQSGLGAVVMTNQQNESVFNDRMMDLIFGAPDGTRYFDGTAEPAGAYRIARTILAGPLKILSVGFTGDFDREARQPWHYAPGQPGGTLVQYTHTDYIRVPWAVMIIEIVLFCGGLAAAALSAVILTAKLICAIMLTHRKRVSASDSMCAEAHENCGIMLTRRKRASASDSGSGSPRGIWQSVSCGAVLLSAVLFGYVALQASSFAAYDDYRWGFYGIAVLMAFMAALFVYGIFCAVKNRPAGKKGSENGIKKSSGKGRILNAAVLAVLFFVLAFTGYFQMWRLWII